MIQNGHDVKDAIAKGINRYMRRPYTDWEFLFYLVPENKMSAKKRERFIEYSKLRKAERKKKEAVENKNRA